MRLRGVFRLLKETATEWQEDKVPVLAAALSYYTVFSLAPLLLIAIAIAGAVFGEEAARGEVVKQIQGLVGQEGAEAIQSMIQNAQKPESGGAIAVWHGVSCWLFAVSIAHAISRINRRRHVFWQHHSGVCGLKSSPQLRDFVCCRDGAIRLDLQSFTRC